ncbi:unnamed protein product, partial [Sphacelaria rigidula]
QTPLTSSTNCSHLLASKRKSNHRCGNTRMMMLLRPAVFLALAPILPAVIHDGDDSEGPSLGVSPPDITDGAGVALSVFVYDEPAFDNSDLIECYQQEHKGMSPWQDERTDTAQDMAEVWMHRALLQHPWRVLDPAKADLFYVPIYPVL